MQVHSLLIYPLYFSLFWVFFWVFWSLHSLFVFYTDKKKVGVLAIVVGIAIFGFDAKAATVVFDSTVCSSAGATAVGQQAGSGQVVLAAQKFTVTGTLSSLVFNISLEKSGTPTDDIFFTIESDSFGVPDGFPVATSSVVSGTGLNPIGSGFITTSIFNFTGSISSAGDYWLVAQRNGLLDNTNFYYVNISTTPACAGLTGIRKWDGTIWTSPSSQKMRGLLEGSTVPPTTPNEIVVPPVGPSTVTVIPFDVSGTCDAGTYSELRVELFNSETSQIVENQVVQCVADAWETTMGAGAWDGSYDVSLYPNDFVSVALDSNAFTLSVPTNPNAPPIIPDTPEQTDCGLASDLVERLTCFLTNSIGKIIYQLFVPSPIVTNQFVNLFNEVKAKPPIGYLTASLGAWDLLTVGSSPDELEGTATLSAYFDPVKVVVGSILWALFAVYLVRRVSTITI